MGYNRRGFEEKQNKIPKDTKDSDVSALLDRNKCFTIVAAAVKEVVSDSAVDLKSPEVKTRKAFTSPLFKAFDTFCLSLHLFLTIIVTNFTAFCSC